jgi:hypothetical protein
LRRSLSTKVQAVLQIALGAHVPLWIAVAGGSRRAPLLKRFSPGIKRLSQSLFCEDRLNPSLWSGREAIECSRHPNIGMLAASANASDYAVDVRVFLVKDRLRSRRRFENVGCAWLVVTYRRRPRSSCSFVSCPPWTNGRCGWHGIVCTVANDRYVSPLRWCRSNS